MRRRHFGLESILQGPGAQPDWTALKGKVVVLEFWATWCGPCVAGEADPVDLTRALHEQLGLELAPAKRAVEVLVLAAANRRAVQLENQVTK